MLGDEKEEEEENQREKAKEKILHEAAMKGSVNSLLQLLQEDPQILNKTTPSPSDTLLHISALLGHSAFTKELLSRNPELAGESNSQGSSPLHVAAAKGYVEIVKNLVLVNPALCLAKDHEGRTPLHLAAIKGRVGALTELVRVRPEATRLLTNGGESGLHLCVKYNRLEALKVLVEGIGRDDEFVNWRDSDGNTVLHIAVAKKQLEIIKYLLTNTRIEVKARNANGFTALDVLSNGPRDLRDMEIKDCLQKHGAPRMNEAQSTTYEHDTGKVSPTKQPLISQKTEKKHTDWLGRKRSALMIVASLIATVAFQAAVSPPGGVWQDEYLVDSDGNPVENPHKVGLSVMASTFPKRYGQFMIFNTIAFLASLSIIMLLISGLPMKRRRWMWTQMVIMWLAISAQTCTYFLGLIHMTPKHVEGVMFQVTSISVLVWLAMMGLVFVGNITRMVLWLLRKYGYIKEKHRESPVDAEDDENDE